MHGLLNTRGAGLVLGLIVASMFLAANLGTSARSPVIWQDEVMFADPAVNLHFGQGFTSSAWFQRRDSMFAGNSPLYSLCLYPWIGAFGFDVVAVRGLNYVLILGVVATGLVGLKRLGLVSSPVPALVFALLVLCGDGVTYSYRSGRYDCLGMLLISLVVLTLTSCHPSPRAMALFLLAVLVPWAGLQLIAYLALIGLALLLIQRRGAAIDVLAIGAGCVVGVLSLFLFLHENGVWPEFLKSVSILSGARRTIVSKLASAVAAPFTEPSSIGLLAVLGVLLFQAVRSGEFRLRSPLGVGLLAGVLVPCLLALAGKYARYYAWMAFIPMAGCVAAELQSGRWRPHWRVVVPLLVMSCVVGLPARLAVTLREWKLRDPDPVNRLVAEQVRPTDWVYSEYEAYYPAKKAAAVLFLPPYAGLTPEMEGTRAAPVDGRPRRGGPAHSEAADRSADAPVLRRPLVPGRAVLGGRRKSTRDRRQPGSRRATVRAEDLPSPAGEDRGCPLTGRRGFSHSAKSWIFV